MQMTKPGNKPDEQIFVGSCTGCKAEFEAKRSELKVESCPREHYEFARARCECCGSTTSLIMYPRRQS